MPYYTKHYNFNNVIFGYKFLICFLFFFLHCFTQNPLNNSNSDSMYVRRQIFVNRWLRKMDYKFNEGKFPLYFNKVVKKIKYI